MTKHHENCINAIMAQERRSNVKQKEYVFTGKTTGEKGNKYVMANKKCNKCGGRGTVGHNITHNFDLGCKCVKILPAGLKINYMTI